MNTCLLCKSIPCCPEHCCDWDSCECGDCETCIKKPEIVPQQPKILTQEPVKIILIGHKNIETAKNIEEKSYNSNDEEFKTTQDSFKNYSYDDDIDSKLNSFKEEIEENKGKNKNQESKTNIDFSLDDEEHKLSIRNIHSPKAAGNSIFGIRYLKSKK